MIALRRFFVLCIAVLAWTIAAGASAGPPPVDPKQMSGMPRPDPEVPAGAVSVRVLLGSFDNPALEHPVVFLVVNADGTKTDTRKAVTGNQGRVTFDGLGDFIGGYAVAEVEFDGVALRSQPIDLRADVGTRVMLVQGARSARADVPLPGIAFDFDRSAAGSVTVGTFHLGERRPLEGVEVTLTIQPPEGAPIERKAKSDKDGRAVFDKLAPPDVPEGSLFKASAQLVADGPIKVSNEFALKPERGMMVILAEGRLPTAPPPEAKPAAGPARRVPGPRSAPDLQQGEVRVRLVDGADQPVADHPVAVLKKTASGTDVEFPGTTDARGIAVVSGIEVQSDAFYLVAVTYDGGPYTSGFFQLDKAEGVAVDLRVYAITHDPSLLKSAVQYEVDGSENDLARVIRLHEVLVEGDKAFWPLGGEMHIVAQDGAKGLTVLGAAEPWLDHEEKADFVQLRRPLPPGEVVNLSIGYLVEHDGDAEIEFAPPFGVVQTAVVLDKELTLRAHGARPSDRESPRPELAIYDLGERKFGGAISLALVADGRKSNVSLGPRMGGDKIEFVVSGLPIRNPIYRQIAAWIGGAMALALIAGLALRPRASARDRLVQRRDQLFAMLEKTPTGPRRDRIVAALDRIFRQLEGLEAAAARRRARGAHER